MSRRALFFLLLAIASFVGGLATGRSLWFIMSYLLTLLLITSFIWTWASLHYTTLSRVTRNSRSQVGELFEERMILGNSSWLPKLWIEIEDQSTFPNHSISRVVHGLLPRKKSPWQVQTVAKMRGRYRLGPIVLQTSDPFGLFSMKRKIDAQANIVVHPLVIDIHQFPSPQGMRSGGEAIRKRTFQMTPNVSGIREYVPGDSFGRIHWKSTARRNQLIVKEFEFDPQVDIWIIPDMDATVQVAVASRPFQQEPVDIKRQSTAVDIAPTTEEYIVTIAASISQYFLGEGRSVGVSAWSASHELIQPDQGQRQLNRILETFAMIRANGNMALSNILLGKTNQFHRGSTLIVITSTTDDDWGVSARELQRQGFHIITILVDPAGFGVNFSNKELYELMQANGLLTYQLTKGDNVTNILNQ